MNDSKTDGGCQHAAGRRSLSSASGPGLKSIPTTLISRASLPDPRGQPAFFFLFVSSSRYVGAALPGAAAISLEACEWAADADGTGQATARSLCPAPPMRRAETYLTGVLMSADRGWFIRHQ